MGRSWNIWWIVQYFDIFLYQYILILYALFDPTLPAGQIHLFITVGGSSIPGIPGNQQSLRFEICHLAPDWGTWKSHCWFIVRIYTLGFDVLSPIFFEKCRHLMLFVTRSLLVRVWVWGWTCPRSGPGSRSWLWPRTKIYELDIIYLEIKFDQLYALNEASWMISSLKSKLGTCWTEENFLPDVGDLQDLKSTVCGRQRPLIRI